MAGSESHRSVIHHPRLPIFSLTLFVVLSISQMQAVGRASERASAGTRQAHPASTVDPCNSLLAIQVASDGTFNLGAAPTSACGADANSWDLLYRWPGSPGTSFTTVKVDGSAAELGDGTVVDPPHDTGPLTNVGSFQHGDVKVTQTLSVATNPQTGDVDAARIAYTVQNTGAVAHDVGIRAMLDTEINYNDGAPFRIPGVGAITTEQDLSGASLPPAFQVFFDLTDSSHVGAATLTGADATTPDRVVIAAWPDIFPTLWDYTTTLGKLITSDSSYAAYWNPAALAPGGSHTYVTYYGVGSLSLDTTPPLALGVAGAAELTCTGGSYVPDPFDVTATVLNVGTADAHGVTATINLPPALSLASGTAGIDLGDIAVGAEVQGSWSVHAAPQATATDATYSVTLTATDAPTKTVDRDVHLPACGGAGQETLDVALAGTGSGSVSSSPPGINCAPTCSASFDDGTLVTLAAVADAGSTFSGWSGEGCSGTGTCQVTMDQARSVTATFDLSTASTPTCALGAITNGPPSQVQLAVQDTGSGLASVKSHKHANVKKVIEPFTPGTTSPVSATFTKLEETKGGFGLVNATNEGGSSLKCGAIFKTVEPRRVFTQGFLVGSRKDTLDLQNASPGLRSATIVVNGTVTHVKLTPGAHYELVLGPMLHKGKKNSITVTGHGHHGHSAVVAVWGRGVAPA